MAERVTVGLLDRRSGGRTDVREEKIGTDLLREIAEVAIVPGRTDARYSPGVSRSPYQPTP